MNSSHHTNCSTIIITALLGLSAACAAPLEPDTSSFIPEDDAAIAELADAEGVEEGAERGEEGERDESFGSDLDEREREGERGERDDREERDERGEREEREDRGEWEGFEDEAELPCERAEYDGMFEGLTLTCTVPGDLERLEYDGWLERVLGSLFDRGLLCEVGGEREEQVVLWCEDFERREEGGFEERDELEDEDPCLEQSEFAFLECLESEEGADEAECETYSAEIYALCERFLDAERRGEGL